MKSAVTEQKGLKRKIEFTVPSVKVDEVFLRNYQKIQKKVKLHGFRQGKAPLNQVKAHYKDQALKEVIDDLVQSFYPLALKENQLNPAGPPTLLDLKLEEGKDSQFVLEIEVHPEVKVESYLNLELKKKEIVISEDNVNQTLERLRESCASYVESLLADQSVKKGDHLTLDLTIFDLENKKLLSKSDLLLQVGQDLIAKNFDQSLLGLKRGQEKDFDFSFPKDHLDPKMAGLTLKVQLKVKSFKNKKVPELDDDFAKRFKVETLLELREKIKTDLKKNQEQKEKERMENHLMEQLIEKNPLELPQTLIASQKQELTKNIKKRLEEYKMSPEQQELYLKKHDQEIEKEAKVSLHSSYLLEQLIKDLKIELSLEDIQNSLQESFPNKKAEEMEQELKKGQYWNAFIFNLTRKKTISYLMEKNS